MALEHNRALREHRVQVSKDLLSDVATISEQSTVCHRNLAEMTKCIGQLQASHKAVRKVLGFEQDFCDKWVRPFCDIELIGALPITRGGQLSPGVMCRYGTRRSSNWKVFERTSRIDPPRLFGEEI